MRKWLTLLASVLMLFQGSVCSARNWWEEEYYLKGIPPIEPLKALPGIQPLSPIEPLKALPGIQPLSPIEPLKALPGIQPLSPIEPLKALPGIQPLSPIEPLKALPGIQPLSPIEPLKALPGIQPIRSRLPEVLDAIGQTRHTLDVLVTLSEEPGPELGQEMAILDAVMEAAYSRSVKTRVILCLGETQLIGPVVPLIAHMQSKGVAVGICWPSLFPYFYTDKGPQGFWPEQSLYVRGDGVLLGAETQDGKAMQYVDFDVLWMSAMFFDGLLEKK